MLILKKTAWISFIISVQGYLFISWLFTRTLFNPVGNVNLLYNAGVVILTIEFLNIHSNVLLYLLKDKLGKELTPLLKTFLFIAYSIFVLFLSIFSGSTLILLIFFVSLISRIFADKAVHSRFPTYQFVIFIGALIVATLGIGFWESMFSFPQEVYKSKPENITGIIFEKPQTLLIWGALYYFTLSIVEIILFISGKRRLVRR